MQRRIQVHTVCSVTIESRKKPCKGRFFLHVAIACRPTRKYTIDIAAKQAVAAAAPSVVEKAALLRTKSIRYTRRLSIYGVRRALYTEKKGGERFCKLCKKRGAEEGGGRSLQKGVSASAAATNPTVRPSVLKRVRSPLSIDSVLCANRSEKGGRSSVQKPALLFSSPPRAPVLGLGIGTTFRKESSRAYKSFSCLQYSNLLGRK